MAPFNKGLSSNVNLPPGNKSGGLDQFSEAISKINNGIKIGRVTDIILNEEYPGIENYGGNSAIGTIFYELNRFIGDNNGIAKPFFPQMSSYPLVNEMVLLFQLPDKNLGKSDSDQSYYYINMISLWNHPHHNAYPNPLKNDDIPPSQQKTYLQTQAGSPNKLNSNESINLNFNSPINASQQTFEERPNIHPLLPFAGDVIHEGRWGNSIRLGSTAATNTSLKNDWSSFGNNGDPITIMINGHDPDNINPGYIHTTENINGDLSSIYMTSTQLLPINVANRQYKSYSQKDKPTFPHVYNTSPQVIINSGRLIFNSKDDHLLLSSQKSIFLGANSTVNISSRGMVVDSLDIKLGSKDAEESMILGDTFLTNLELILKELSTLCKVISKIKEVSWVNPETGEPNKKLAVNGQLSSIANNLSDMIEGSSNSFLSEIDSYKSKVNKIL